MPSEKKSAKPPVKAPVAKSSPYVAVRDVRWTLPGGSGEAKSGKPVPEWVVDEVPWFVTHGDVRTK